MNKKKKKVFAKIYEVEYFGKADGYYTHIYIMKFYMSTVEKS